ncbi:MAG: hypothetical protein ACE5FG_06335 [Myxococcota bacterium]
MEPLGGLSLQVAAPLSALLLVIGALGVFLASTVVFDTIHYLLHRCHDSGWPVLRQLGGLHEVHHRFLDRDLRLHPEYLRANLVHHVIPEYLTHVSFSLCLLWILPASLVYTTLGLQTLVVLFILSRQGMDPNHVEVARIPAYRPMYLCVPAYHWLHHRHPEAYMSSYIKLFDHLVGTGATLRGRQIALDGAATPFGAALREQLENAGVARVVSLEEMGEAGRARLDSVLQGSDVLVVADAGRAAESCAGVARELIERFRELTRERKVAPEVWAVAPARSGSQDFERYARAYYHDPRLIYRHIVLPERVRSGAEIGWVARACARIALFLIRRGLNYVPITATGLVPLGFLRFRFLTQPLRPARRAAA